MGQYLPEEEEEKEFVDEVPTEDMTTKAYAFCSDGAQFRQNVAANQP